MQAPKEWLSDIWSVVKMGPPTYPTAFRGTYDPSLPVDAWYDFEFNQELSTITCDIQGHAYTWPLSSGFLSDNLFTEAQPWLNYIPLCWSSHHVKATGICYPMKTHLLLYKHLHTWTYPNLQVTFSFSPRTCTLSPLS